MALLEPFMKAPRSLSDAASDLGIKLPRLSYHVNRFLTMGLLYVAGTERRTGRSIKLYSSTAQSFSVPFRLTESDTLETLFTALTASEATHFRRGFTRTLQDIAPDWSINILCDDRGLAVRFAPLDETLHPFNETVLGGNFPALFSVEGRFTLDVDTAKALQHDLAELFKGYTKKQVVGGQRYAVRLGVTPIQDESLE